MSLFYAYKQHYGKGKTIKKTQTYCNRMYQKNVTNNQPRNKVFYSVDGLDGRFELRKAISRLSREELGDMILDIIHQIESMGSVAMPKCEDIKQEHLNEAIFLYVVPMSEGNWNGCIQNNHSQTVHRSKESQRSSDKMVAGMGSIFQSPHSRCHKY